MAGSDWLILVAAGAVVSVLLPAIILIVSTTE